MSLSFSLLITFYCVVATPANVSYQIRHFSPAYAGVSAEADAPLSQTAAVDTNQDATTATLNETSKAGGSEDTNTSLKFLDYPGKVLSFVGSSLLVILLVVFSWAAFWEFRRKTIIIDPIEVGKDLAEKGYTPHAIAQRIAGELAALQRTAHIASLSSGSQNKSAT
jgi:hypothetical protein